MEENKAPDKLYIDSREHWRKSWTAFTTKAKGDDIEYTRTDAFIEKALKWYCLDCACNDNCKYKCAFWSFFKDYLEGNDKALPPKIENALNPDGSTTDNYRYRHFLKRVQDTFIEKAEVWLKLFLNNSVCIKDVGERAKRVIVDDLRKAMKG